jgi:hypothetical protein
VSGFSKLLRYVEFEESCMFGEIMRNLDFLVVSCIIEIIVTLGCVSTSGCTQSKKKSVYLFYVINRICIYLQTSFTVFRGAVIVGSLEITGIYRTGSQEIV